ncbi:MAG: tetratricopeptide repeat protein [Bacteroidaceae bacterium]|nr:tetratricopeptide repeat protein [Bacteroidaceae bacterium]
MNEEKTLSCQALVSPTLFRHLGKLLLILFFFLPQQTKAQINTDRVMLMGRSALYYEDYVLAIQRFNMVISARPYLAEPYFYRGLGKFYLEDFTGAEQDCDQSIERNPYITNFYQLRAICRVNQKKYQAAIADYRRVIDMEPKSKPSWHNLVLCLFELKQWEEADSAVDEMIRMWPKESEHYTLKAEVAMERGDTAACLTLIDTALAVNPYDGQALVMRSSINLQHGLYAQAEQEMDKALVQLPRMAGIYINRALARFHQNNLRGAMADYDHALELEPNNYIGHFNRGLLRAEVGDDNHAIEDFDFVLKVEPDNMIALFNRALLLDNTGDYRGAIRDISAVIAEYPDFLIGYQQRAAIRRKIGDTYGAERDEFKVMQSRMQARAGKKTQPHKTRKKSERDINSYLALVEADTEEPQREYASVYRGRVQDHRVELSPQPIFAISYHRTENSVSRYVPYYKLLEKINAGGHLSRAIYINNVEPPIGQAEMEQHTASINDYTERINTSETAELYIGRALDYYQVHDFESALTDLNRALALDKKNVLGYFIRAQVRCRQMEALNIEEEAQQSTIKIGYSAALDDLTRAVQLAPDMAYAWYDIGNIHFVLHDYTRAREAYRHALNIDPHFPDAYYNRGVASILDGQLQLGLSDLSQAGEYGLYQAYNLIKRYSKQASAIPQK